MPDSAEQSLRDRILDTARELLIADGYRNLSMRKIARRIGVSATSIYLHFDHRDHLLHSLMEEAIDRLNGVLEAAARTSTDPVERLEKVARAYIKFSLENPYQYQMIYVVRSEEMSRYPKEKFRRARRGYELLEEIIREGVQQGMIEDDNPRIAAYSFWAQLHGLMSVVHSKRLDTRIDRDIFLEKALHQVLKGLIPAEGLKKTI